MTGRMLTDGSNPCRWTACVEPAFADMPVCAMHAVEIWRQVERRGMGIVQDGPSQYAGTAGHPVVYYVELHPGIVKIGTTAQLVERVKSLRVDFDKVLAAEPGGYPKERHRHQQFAGSRIGRREDFRVTADLDEHIRELRQTFGDPVDIAREQHTGNRVLLAEINSKR